MLLRHLKRIDARLATTSRPHLKRRGWVRKVESSLEIWDLNDPRCIDAKRVGPKAANLAMLSQRGLAIPEGVCIPWTKGRFVPPRNGQLQLLQSTVERLSQGGITPLIVRSSATCEDSDSALFAGRFESILDNYDVESVIHATVQVHNSLQSARARDYAQCLGISLDDVAMSVIIQRQIQPEYSGAFASQSPHNPDLALLEMVPGHCAGALKGESQPISIELETLADRIITTRVDSAIREDSSIAAVIQSVRMAGQRLIELLRDGSDAADAPIEFEWGYAVGTCWLFQMRRTGHVVENLKHSEPADIPQPSIEHPWPDLTDIAPYGLKAWSADYFRRMNMGPKSLVTIHPRSDADTVRTAIARHVPSVLGSAIRFSNASNDKGLPRAFVPSGVDIVPIFLDKWKDHETFGLVHEYVPVDHSFEAYFDETNLIVEHVPGLWESGTRLPPDVFVFEKGEPPVIYRYQRHRMANLERPRMTNLREVPPLSDVQVQEWSDRFIRLFRRIRTDLRPKLAMPLNVHFIGTEEDWHFLNIRPTPPVATIFVKPTQIHVINRVEDLLHWDRRGSLLLQISADRGSETATIGSLALEIRRRWADPRISPRVYVPFGLLSHPALVLREFGVTVFPFFSEHSVEKLDGMFW